MFHRHKMDSASIILEKRHAAGFNIQSPSVPNVEPNILQEGIKELDLFWGRCRMARSMTRDCKRRSLYHRVPCPVFGPSIVRTDLRYIDCVQAWLAANRS